MNDRRCGISKHIHLEEDVNALLGDSGFCLEMKRMKTLPLKEKKDILDSSDALSDQVSSLDIYAAEEGRDREVYYRGSCV